MCSRLVQKAFDRVSCACDVTRAFHTRESRDEEKRHDDDDGDDDHELDQREGARFAPANRVMGYWG